MKQGKRVLAVLLSAVFLAGSVPGSVFAAETVEAVEESTEQGGQDDSIEQEEQSNDVSEETGNTDEDRSENDEQLAAEMPEDGEHVYSEQSVENEPDEGEKKEGQEEDTVIDADHSEEIIEPVDEDSETSRDALYMPPPVLPVKKVVKSYSEKVIKGTGFSMGDRLKDGSQFPYNTRAFLDGYVGEPSLESVNPANQSNITNMEWSQINVKSSKNLSGFYNGNYNSYSADILITGYANSLGSVTYLFTGTANGQNGNGVFEVPKITIQVISNQYTVNLNANGGTCSKSIHKVQYKQPYAYLGELPTPTRKGYKFTGWYTKKTDGTKVTGTTVFSNATAMKNGTAITLYANWTPVTYTITYHMNGGTNPKNNVATYTVEKPVTFANPTRVGYAFDGWYLDNTGSTSITSTKGYYKALNVYALWTECAHTFNTVKTVNPTCTTGGSATYQCSKCKYQYTDKTAALGHNWEFKGITWKESDGGYAAEGAYVCKNDESHTQNINAVVTSKITEKTCTVDGKTEYTAVINKADSPDGIGRSDAKTVAGEPAGHTLKKTSAKAATCTKAGNSAYWYCSACGKYFSDGNGRTVIAKNSWVISALGHDWSEWQVVKDATEEENGLERRICGNDASHTEERMIPMLVHDHELVKTDAKASTCTEDGNISYWTCSKCKRIYRDKNGTVELSAEETVIHAPGHSWNSAYTVDKAATCKAKGTESIHCAVCGEVKEGTSRAIPKAAHKYGDWVVTKEPTRTETGMKERVCSVCKGKQQMEIPVLKVLPIEEQEISGIINKVYTGNKILQSIEIRGKNIVLKEGTDYTVTYSDNINPGTATVTVNGIGNYAGTKTATFLILPGKTSRGDMFNLANNVKVTWNEVQGAKYYKVYREGVTDPGESLDEPVIVTERPIGWDTMPGLTNGHAYRYRIVASLTGKGDSSGDSPLSYSKLMYRLKTVVIRSVKNTEPGKVTVRYDKTTSGDSYVLQYSENEDMSGAKTKVVLGADNTSYTIGRLKKEKTYYISIRVRKKVDGIDYYTTFGVSKRIRITQ